MRNSQRRFSSAARIDQSKKFTDPAACSLARARARAHGAAVTSLRETRYRHEKITGEFFQGAPQHETRTCECRWPVCARPRCCLSVNSYVHACVRAITWVCTRTRSRLNRSSRGDRRYESVRGGAVWRRGELFARRTEVNRFLTLISALSSDLDRKALRKNAWKKSGYVSRKCKREFRREWEYSENTFFFRQSRRQIIMRVKCTHSCDVKHTELYVVKFLIL